MAGLTVAQAIEAAAARLRSGRLTYGHGTLNAREEAAWLVLHACRIPPSEFEGRMPEPVSPARQRRIDRLVDRRIAERVPAAYLTRQAWLGEHEFYVDRRVIVPRSFIAEWLPEDLGTLLQRPIRSALDLCTGSGCLAILVALAYPRSKVDAVELSRPALAVARRNVAAYRLESRVSLVHSDLFSAVRGRRYDLIVSNPPYVKESSMARLPAEHRAEPRMALAGGNDGLDLVRRILRQAREHLRPRGTLVCEIGHNRNALERAYPRTPFTWLETSAGDGYVFLVDRESLPA